MFLTGDQKLNVPKLVQDELNEQVAKLKDINER
jgi:hypothetical protein